MATVTKKELVNRIARELDAPKVRVASVIQRFLDSITEALVRGDRVEFREFGVFEVKDRAPRPALNPKTGERVQVPARRVAKFKPGSRMRACVASGSLERPAAPPKAEKPPAPLEPPTTASPGPADPRMPAPENPPQVPEAEPEGGAEPQNDDGPPSPFRLD